MKTSARNTLPGTISKIAKGAVNSEVLLATRGGDEIAAIITNGSVEAMGSKEGMEVYALVKASWTTLGPASTRTRSVRGIFCMVLSRVFTRGA